MVEARDNESSNADAAAKTIRVNVFGRTDVGMVREHNEDNFLIADLSRKNRSIQPEVQQHEIGELGSVFAVCDGMGGAAAGEVASKLGVDIIYDVLQNGSPPEDEIGLALRLNEAICEAGRFIYEESKANSARRGMGTTATVAVLMNERIFFGQVGDSRAHIVRNGRLAQTTKDQSLVQQLIDANQLTIEEARNFDRSNIILQALGTSEEVHVDVTSTLLRKGDILVICSDGLSGMVEPEDIRDVVLSIDDPIEACQKLTQMACDNGGDDNVTVIVARFDGDGLAEPSDDDVVQYDKYTMPGMDDDESITIPRGMPTVPGSGMRTNIEGGFASQEPSRRLPFLVLLSALILVGLVIGFSWKGSKSKNDGSAALNGNSSAAHSLGTEDSGNKSIDTPDMGVKNKANVLPDGMTAEITDSEYGDLDSEISDTSALTEGIDDADSSEMGDEGDEDDMDAALMDSDMGDDAQAENVESGDKNSAPEDGGTSEETDGGRAGSDAGDKSSGKWTRTKLKRKRRSEQESPDDDIAEPDESSDEDSTDTGEQAPKKVPDAENISSDESSSGENEETKAPSAEETAPSVPEENPY
ncbi:MAG: protein phosphatase 2C domain-containing protein [Deltaproteobacteria bacterium]|nr:protein phosphatase 2C domain-containing protein [Deltaproteobacteria bacterium]